MHHETHARPPLPPPEVIRQLPADGGPDYNRLIHETSPYLRQHAANPVDWHPWGEAALARARAGDKPVFLSVGYSACHWCHVMEHESFERADVAEILNAHFVCIKVDREERPDLDDVYMAATQLMSGRGGWPNSLWLLPDGRPWYAGTYFPREDAGGRPGFKTLLRRLAEIWATRRAEVEAQADELAAALRANAAAVAGGRGAADPAGLARLADDALGALAQAYDPRHGGFGGAPKFPPHGLLAFLLSEHRRTGDAAALAMARGTLDALLRGGIRDHVGGGFHRYATDERWLLPHFEKMLYDNAQLARVLAAAFAATGHAPYAEAARETCDWVLREMTDPRGGFYSALDADSEGEEGKYYVWSRGEVLDVLGAEAGERFGRVYNIAAHGNYQDEATGRDTGLNIPHLRELVAEDERSALAAARRALLEHRQRRVPPALDDKVLTAWNGLMIGALAACGRELAEPRFTAAAEKAARFILSDLRRDGQLLRTWRDGRAHIPAFLEDYACLADGLLDLHEATGQPAWRDEAAALARQAVARFGDAAGGGFFTTADGHETLLVRTQDPFDQSVPSGNGVLARVLLRLGLPPQAAADRRLAAETIMAFATSIRRAPTGAGSLLLAASLALQAGDASPVRVEAGPPPAPARPGETVEVGFRLLIPPGWHLRALAVAGARLAAPPDAAAVHTGAVDLLARVDIPPDATSGELRLPLLITFQPCGEARCLAPETRVLLVRTVVR